MVPPCTVKGVCVIIQNLQIKYNICEPLEQQPGKWMETGGRNEVTRTIAAA